ncbi:MAG: glycosyltransferase family 2 protein [Rikenellaceae bacterium]
MLDISVIILTYNEELHIRRCIENILPIAKDIFLVDSYSTDKTEAIALELGAKVLKNRWENNHAKQFNWGLANCPIKTQWVLRLDADEYLTPELLKEINSEIGLLEDDISGVIFNRRHIFMEKWMKRGVYPVKLLRLFRYGKAMCEQRLMDEHIQLTEGKAIEFKNDFCDHNLNNLSWFCHKHVDYAVREAADLLDIELNITTASQQTSGILLCKQAKQKRINKYRYARQPLFFRSFAYFCYRYFFKGAFLDGKVGFIWTFMQGWWYRTLVDAKVYEIKSICGKDKEKICLYLKEHYKLDIQQQPNENNNNNSHTQQQGDNSRYA